MSQIHNVRDHFSIEKFLKARELTIKAVDQISKQAFVGMNEKDGHDIIDKVLGEMGCEKKWHPNKFRIGKNTTKSFRDISDEDIILKENDIFFIDIGPVWDNHEGDYGDTFIIGENSKFREIADASKIVFNETARAWSKNHLSGIELYQFAKKVAIKLGFNLNERMKGHRVGDFPHHLFYKGGLNEIEESPCNHLWILEIHLVSKDEMYGSFFEDILQK